MHHALDERGTGRPPSACGRRSCRCRPRRRCTRCTSGRPGVSSTVRSLMPVGNAAPPRPRRPLSVTSVTTSAGCIGERPAQADQAAVGHVVVGVARVDDADATERDALLAPASTAARRRGRGAAVLAAGRPARAAPARRSTVTVAVARRGPAAVSTSTSGSSQSMPREPLRTTRTPGCGGERRGDVVGAGGAGGGVAGHVHGDAVAAGGDRRGGRGLAPARRCR